MIAEQGTGLSLKGGMRASHPLEKSLLANLAYYQLIICFLGSFATCRHTFQPI